MTTIAAFDFVSGRYHATPWGRHVNEGAIEWPPSPWRLLRALIATGFNRLSWTDGIPALARGLLERLAEQPPRYHLPPANASHTRHYMPLFDGKTTKVLDTFAVVAAPLFVEWPVALETQQRDLLGALLDAMPYLGRAESWVHARLVDAGPTPDDTHWCSPAKQPPSLGYERVDAIAPLPAAGYSAWRTEHVSASALLMLEVEKAKAIEKGKRPPEKLTAKQVAEVEARYPSDLCEMLRVATATLQADGWSVPPGSRWITYWRANDALESLQRERSAAARAQVNTIVFAASSRTVSGKTLPPLRRGLQIAEGLHRAVAKLADGADQPSVTQLVGKDAQGDKATGHLHAYLLPVASKELSLQRTKPGMSSIDHIVLHVRGGMTNEARSRVEKGLRTLYTREAMLKLVPIWSGESGAFAAFPPLQQSRVWLSHSPYVCPRHLKKNGRNTLWGQVSEELASLGIEGLLSVEFEARDSWVGSDSVLTAIRSSSVSPRWRSFIRARSIGPQPPGHQPALGLRLTFDRLVQGPIAIGYASHFGLGFMQPGAVVT